MAVELVVVVCTHQGQAYLDEQLDSIACQTLSPDAVLVHDDASRDDTVAMARRHPIGSKVTSHADNAGVVGNFERGLADALQLGARYVALADQDDVWHEDKLNRSLALMQELEAVHGAHTPVLVHSDLAMVDTDRKPMAPSFLGWRGYASGNAANLASMLGQSGVMGNTCLANRALLELALPFPAHLHVHDWWLGVVAQLHGQRGYIDAPLLDYRIHRSNASNAIDRLDGGAGRGSVARLLRRDFRLPFKEDSRATAVQALLLREPGPPSHRDRQTIVNFLSYLHWNEGRFRQLLRLLRFGFLKPGLRHRLRVALAVLLTTRYGKPRPSGRHAD